MQIRIDPSALRTTRWYEYGIRFLFWRPDHCRRLGRRPLLSRFCRRSPEYILTRPQSCYFWIRNSLTGSPRLPSRISEWGKGRVSLKLFRTPDGKTDYDVLRLDGPLHVVRQPSPWSITSDWPERVKDAVLSLKPSHR